MSRIPYCTASSSLGGVASASFLAGSAGAGRGRQRTRNDPTRFFGLPLRMLFERVSKVSMPAKTAPIRNASGPRARKSDTGEGRQTGQQLAAGGLPRRGPVNARAGPVG
jgi:hypothetical protein